MEISKILEGILHINSRNIYVCHVNIPAGYFLEDNSLEQNCFLHKKARMFFIGKGIEGDFKLTEHVLQL